jgi:hypothetical protein
MKSIKAFINEAIEKPNKNQLLTIIAGKISEFLLGLECDVPGYAVGEDDEDSVEVSWEEAIECGHYTSLTELLDTYSYFDELVDETKDTLHMTADQLSRFIDTNEDEILKLIQ